jgi:hypothetical protein
MSLESSSSATSFISSRTCNVRKAFVSLFTFLDFHCGYCQSDGLMSSYNVQVLVLTFREWLSEGTGRRQRVTFPHPNRLSTHLKQVHRTWRRMHQVAPKRRNKLINLHGFLSYSRSPTCQTFIHSFTKFISDVSVTSQLIKWHYAKPLLWRIISVITLP